MKRTGKSLVNLAKVLYSVKQINSSPVIRPLSTKTTTPTEETQQRVPSKPEKDSFILENFKLRKLKGSAKTNNPENKPSPPQPEQQQLSNIASEREKSSGSNAEVVSSFQELGLKAEMIKVDEKMGLFVPSEIQCVGIPAVLNGKSVVLSSGSGSGRTLAYLLPLVQMLRRDEALLPMKPMHPRAIVLCTTEESADQGFHMAKFISHCARLDSSMENGGVSSKAQEFWKMLSRAVCNSTRTAFIRATPVSPYFAAQQSPFYQQERYGASLKELKNRMSTIKSIQKITGSMNKLATSKLKAARDKMEKVAQPLLKVNVAMLKDLAVFESKAEDAPIPNEKEVFLIVTTDRGMCGATNSGIIRSVKLILRENPQAEVPMVICGNKGVAGFKREYGDKFELAVTEIGKKKFSFADMEPFVTGIKDIKDYEKIRVVCNRWQSVVSSVVMHRFLPNPNKIVETMKDAFYTYEYDNTDEAELFENFAEHLTAMILYGCLVENAAVELAFRMNSMDNASTNAAEMYSKLHLLYNRTRQAGITTELSEIISGAASVQEQTNA